MMTFDIKYQEEYSRGEMLLRAFFGFFYIIIPHGFMLMIYGIGLMFISFISFLKLLFTGKWNRSWFDFTVKYNRWNLRVNARMMNLAEGYPAFGLDGEDEPTTFDVKYQEEVSQVSVLIRIFFGFFYVLIPHGIALMFMMIGVMFCTMISFWAILFTGKYPKGMFDFVVKTFRWQQRVNCYMSFLTHEYPKFSGEVLPGENEGSDSAPTSDEILDDVV